MALAESLTSFSLRLIATAYNQPAGYIRDRF